MTFVSSLPDLQKLNQVPLNSSHTPSWLKKKNLREVTSREKKNPVEPFMFFLIKEGKCCLALMMTAAEPFHLVSTFGLMLCQESGMMHSYLVIQRALPAGPPLTLPLVAGGQPCPLGARCPRGISEDILSYALKSPSL